MTAEYEQLAAFFTKVFSRYDIPSGATVLDFGCGAGRLMKQLRQHGYDARGCDVKEYLDDTVEPHLYGPISLAPYRIPFDDNSFDAVISTSVLEHAQNVEEYFSEIHRVLKPGGHSIHIYPGKWYLPTEPHIFVPLVSWIWPYVPKWWLGLWAWLGVRNDFQNGMDWREVRDINAGYCKTGIIYLPRSAYKRVSHQVFGNSEWPTKFYLENSYGRVARAMRKVPFAHLMALNFRMTMIVQVKQAEQR